MASQTTFDMNGKVAFVTGASTGIGRATALLLAKSKAKVMIADINAAESAETLRLIRALDGRAEVVSCDVSRETDVKTAIEKTVQTFGGIDYAFNNAGIEGASGATADCTSENWQHVLQVNLTGVWHCMKYQIPEMLKRGGGAIVNCSSVAGITGFVGIPAYVASKHGVVGLTKAAALEYGKANIRINAVCPGVIQTPMIDRFVHGDKQALEALKASEPIGHMGRPEEIAESVLWLFSDAASFVIGHPLVVDGGMVAQ